MGSALVSGCYEDDYVFYKLLLGYACKPPIKHFLKG